MNSKMKLMVTAFLSALIILSATAFAADNALSTSLGDTKKKAEETTGALSAVSEETTENAAEAVDEATGEVADQADEGLAAVKSTASY